MEKNLTVQYNTADDDLNMYSKLIEENIKSELPVIHINAHEQGNILLDLFLNSRNIRQGPKPGIEQQVSILRCIRTYIGTNEPIPILIPSGPKKTANGQSVDLAEVGVLRNLKCLQKSATNVYEHGFDFVFRMEDVTGLILEGNEAKLSMVKYISDFKNLINVLDMSLYTKVVTETGMLNNAGIEFNNYKSNALMNANIIEKYLLDTIGNANHEFKKSDHYTDLQTIGWSGIIPNIMRDHYVAKYKKLYPDQLHETYISKLALYFGSTLTRKQYVITGKQLFDYGCLEIDYTQPTPGVEETYYSTRVYYRSISMKQSKRNIPFWRAKGVYKINDNNKIRRSLLNWNDKVAIDTIGLGNLVFTNNITSVNVKADTILL